MLRILTITLGALAVAATFIMLCCLRVSGNRQDENNREEEMKIKRYARKYIKKVIALILIAAIMVGMGIVSFATTQSEYTALGASYTANAKVDESIGLRAEATITGGSASVSGIAPVNTKLTKKLDVSNDDTFMITVSPYDNYTLDQVVVSAIAEITHPDGTMEAVKDTQSIPANTASTFTETYTIPDFTGCVESGDVIDVDIVLYADFTYSPASVDCTIDLTNGTVTGSNTGGISVSGKLFTIDTATAAGKTVKVTGETSYVSSSDTNYQIKVHNSAKSVSTRNIHLIFDDVKMYTVGLDYSNYKTYSTTDTPSVFSSDVTNPGTSTRFSNTTINSYALLSLADVDAYVTFTNENILAHSYTQANGGNPNASAIQVDASASLVVTDASTGSLYVRGGGCSAAIGSSEYKPSGYVEIDGGDIIATSAHNSHAYVGIGNGGHYDSTDPGTRGIVINGGKLEALGFHYGIGANGGTLTGGFDNAVGAQYIVITGGEVVSEASGGSAGASIGFAYNNASHDVRIGRPDKDGSSANEVDITSVNWGYGAAISGKMTFYSGTTSAYSGQYAAAIGGNAVSNATISPANDGQAQALSSAITGTPLTVYGGTVTAEAGAFEQQGYRQYDSTIGSDGVRGTSLTRTSAASALNELRPSDSYGAAIGGSISRDGGSENKIFAGTFDVYSSVYGSGIGGGGGYQTQNGGGGGDTWIGNLTDLSTGTIAYMDFTITADNNGYGAGFGGGGSDGGNGGGGGNVYIGGGKFDIYGSVYGAGFGGGGSNSGNGGGGSTVVINDGEFTVYSGLYGAGIGGGGSNSGSGGNGSVAGGTFTVNGGKFTVETGYKWTRSGGVAPHAPSNVAADQILDSSTASGKATSYGAGIGGGGSVSGNGGNGSDNFLATGGYFTSISNGYGAGIGGGGSDSSTAGTGAQPDMRAARS